MYSRNIPLFIAFRLCFHARFYYPIFAILFLDLGLTLEEFSLLNVVWAGVILVLEIPSGALADSMGRKRLLVISSCLMIGEMAALVWAATQTGTTMFVLLLLNRVLSGAAEAASSGADEALAYDSLLADNRQNEWSVVLEKLTRWRSGAFFIAMIVGALVYDAAALNFLSRFLHVPFEFTADRSMLFPVYLTLVTAGAALACAFYMKEPPRSGNDSASTSSPWQNIVQASRYTFASRRLCLLLGGALIFDSIIRIFLTVASNYYRLIHIPEFLNGFLGSAIALLGYLVAPAGKRMVENCSARTNFLTLFLLLLVGVIGAAAATPIVGVWVVVPIGSAMILLQFFLSYYINQWSASAQRATVLSFRGVALNFGYGMAGLAYAGFIASLRQNTGATEEQVFSQSLISLPIALLVGAGFVWGLALLRKK